MPTTTVRAKFECQSVSKRKVWPGTPFVYDATLTAIRGGSEEDESFFEATPAGTIQLSTIKDGLFDPGSSYYVDFTLVKEGE